METPKKDNFTLRKVKLQPKGGIKTDYEIAIALDGEVVVTERSEITGREVHPDFKNAVKALAPVVADVFEFSDETAERIEVRGIAISGEGDKEGVVITSVFETSNGQKTCINTPRLFTAGDENQALDAAVENIRDEVYAYLFEGKQAQLSLFGDNGEAAESNDIPDGI